MVTDGGLLLLGALSCGLFVPLLVGVGARMLRKDRGPQGGDPVDSARAPLDRRLAAGQIGVEEYYERESALRSATPMCARQRRWL